MSIMLYVYMRIFCVLSSRQSRISRTEVNIQISTGEKPSSSHQTSTLPSSPSIHFPLLMFGDAVDGNRHSRDWFFFRRRSSAQTTRMNLPHRKSMRVIKRRRRLESIVCCKNQANRQRHSTNFSNSPKLDLFWRPATIFIKVRAIRISHRPAVQTGIV